MEFIKASDTPPLHKSSSKSAKASNPQQGQTLPKRSCKILQKSQRKAVNKS